MPFVRLLKNDVIHKLLSNNGNVKNVTRVFDELNKADPFGTPKNPNPYIFINRVREIEELNQSINDDLQRLFLIGGFQGAGKSALVKAMLNYCEEQVLIFWYECSKITNLDDILLSLCGYFDKKLRKTSSPPKEKSSVSIDERLISYLKILDRPLLIVLDSIEYLITPELTIEDEELKHFFNYLLNHDLIKLVLIGQKLPTEDMNSTADFVTELRVTGLNEDYSKQLLRDKGLSGSNTLLTEIYKFSRGYPWLLLLTSSISGKLALSPEQIIRDMHQTEDTYESYLIKKIYKELAFREIRLINYLSILRHPVNVPAFQRIDKDLKDPAKQLENLINLMLIQHTGSRYSVNTTVRKHAYNLIPTETKYELHNVVSKFYATEISRKLADRTIRLSRKLLHSEQSFHNLTANKLFTEKDKFDKKHQLAVNYLPTSMKDPYYFSDMIKSTPVEISSDDYKDVDISEASNIVLSESKELPRVTFKYNARPVETPVITDDDIDLDGYKIELSEEEKELLKEDLSETTILPGRIKELSSDYKPFVEELPAEEDSLKPFMDDLDFDFEFGLPTNESRRDGDIDDLIESLRFVALGYASENKHDTAIERYKEAIELCEKSKNRVKLASTLMPMAESYLYLKQYELAIEAYIRARQIYENLEDYSAIPLIIANTGKVYSECYQHEKALQYYNEALKLPAVQYQVKARVLMGIGEIYDYRQQFKDALNYYSQALKAFKEIDDINNLAILYSKIGLLYDDLRDFPRAIEHYEKSLELDRHLGRKNSYAATLANLAAVHDELGQNTEAINYYKQSIIIDKELQNIEGLYKTLNRLGTLYSEMGQSQAALKYYQQELKVAKKAKDPYWIAMAYLDLGDFHYLTKDFLKAAKYFFISQKVISKSISTDSREKIERRIKKLLDYIPKDQLDNIRIQVLKM